jgi:hypothetical protein
VSDHLLWRCAKWDETCDVEGVSALVNTLGWGYAPIHLFGVRIEIC